MIESLEARRLMSAGELDPSFGAGGVVNVADDARTAAVEVLAGGKFLTVHRRASELGDPVELVVSRFLADGSPDGAFGTGGTVELTGFAGVPFNVVEVKEVAGANILIAGLLDTPGGNDTIQGNGGNNYLLGSAGHDSLFGNGGRDTLSGAGGNDQLFGGPGSADRILGGSGADAAANDPLDSYSDVEALLG